MKKFIVVLVMVFAINANAQWVQMTNWNGSGKLITCTAGDSNYLFVGTNIDGLYCSTNNGETFVKTSLNVYIVYSMAFSGNNVFAGTEKGLYRSTDKGNNWSLNSFNYITVNEIFAQGNYLYAATDSINTYKVFFSSNNGAHWTKTNLNMRKISSFTSDSNYIYAGSQNFLPHLGPPIYRSPIGDTSWTIISYIDSTEGGTSIIEALAYFGNYIFAGIVGYHGLDYSVYRSTNSGFNWLSTMLDEGDTYAFTTIGNNLIAATESGIFMSTNYGTNWIIKNQGFGYTYYGIDYLSKNKNYIFAGNIYTMWRRSLTEIVGIQNISTETPSKYSLSQNYPNPFNPITNVKFSILNSGNVKIVVYDITGREVQTLVNERLQPGTYEASYDGSAQNSGVYFYKMVTEGFSETKKMLLIK